MKCNFTGVAKAKRQCRRQKCFLHCLFFMPKRKDIILRSLNGLRTRLISENRYTDAVDELLVKFANAKKKKFKIKIVEQMAVQENVTEQLKANNQMEWISRMNNIQSKSSRFCLDILYSSSFSLTYIHSPLVADHFSVNSLPLAAAVNGFVRNSFIVFSTVL